MAVMQPWLEGLVPVLMRVKGTTKLTRLPSLLQHNQWVVSRLIQQHDLPLSPMTKPIQPSTIMAETPL